MLCRCSAELYDAVTVPGHSGHCCDSLCCDGMMTLRHNYGHTGQEQLTPDLVPGAVGNTLWLSTCLTVETLVYAEVGVFSVINS